MAVRPYPPAEHILRDLDLEVEVRPDATASAWLPVSPHLLGANGGVQAGVLAILVDIVGGAIATRVLYPDRTATADLQLQLLRPAVGPEVEARVSVLRRGRTTLVLEVLLLDAPGGRLPGEGTANAWATMTYAVLPRTDAPPLMQPLPSEAERTQIGPAALSRPVLEAIGVESDGPGSPGVVLPLGDYVTNTFGALQGGVMALLGATAGNSAIEVALGLPRGAASVVDLQVAYLAMGRVGPIVSEPDATMIDDVAGTGHAASAVIRLLDRGGDDRLVAVVQVGAVRP
ncbi:MAG TPA: hotdog domain-containing protein [Acidimicrobiales bacterium]|nr:hotdog domain-containing protein [Acidimicrobiales bacterium]